VPTTDEPAVFLGNASEVLETITFGLVLTIRCLLPSTSPQDRVALVKRLVHLRDVFAMTAKAISEVLPAERPRCAGGAPLETEYDSAMYRKRKLYLARRTWTIGFRITEPAVHPAAGRSL
jgi:hypothetical protein